MAGFFQRVHRLVSLIPNGKVASYGQIAALLGERRAARTVGWALRALPSGSAVPWHRVISARGFITNTCHDDSASKQRALLQEEGVRFGPDDRVDMDIYCWEGPTFDELDIILRD